MEFLKTMQNLNEITIDMMEEYAYFFQGMLVREKETCNCYILALVDFDRFASKEERHKWSLLSTYDFNRYVEPMHTANLLELFKEFEFIGFLNLSNKYDFQNKKSFDDVREF